MAYHIDMQITPVALVPSTLHPSTAAPGMYNLILENGYSIVVEPNGSQVREIAPGEPNWDSPWTQAALYGDKLVFRSSGGVPRGYLVIG